MLEYQRPGTSLFTESVWLLTFTGTEPGIAELRKLVASRLPLLPPLRERVAYSKLRLMRPRWVRDTGFDLSRHVCEADTARFGGRKGWLQLVDELLATRLDRRRPLWRLWLARGGDEERFALVFHHNHAWADGHSALHVLRLLLAVDPGQAQRSSGAQAPRDRSAGTRLRELVEEARSIAAATRLLYPPAPSVPALNRPLGLRRHVLTVDLSMQQVTEIATESGCFPNDVYLTAVAGGLRRWLESREEAPAEMIIQAGIPIKTRSRADRQDLGNHFSGIRLPLPLGEATPLTRLRQVQAQTKQITAGRIARGGELMSRVHNLLPRQLLTPLARAELGPDAINIVISHLVLPGNLRECLGRPLQRLRCWTPLFEDQAISVVAAQGLDGTMTVNLLVEPDLVPDAAELEFGIRETVEELHASLAGKALVANRS